MLMRVIKLTSIKRYKWKKRCFYIDANKYASILTITCMQFQHEIVTTIEQVSNNSYINATYIYVHIHVSITDLFLF